MSKPPETLTMSESEELLMAIGNGHPDIWLKWRNLRNYTMTLLMLDAGLRVGEVCKLKITDLIMNGEAMKALFLDDKLAEKKCVRLIPLTDRLQQAIRQCWSMIWQPTPNFSPIWAFFDGGSMKHISARQVQRIIAAASIRSIGRAIHPHVLRHTFATRLMRVTSTPVVQQLLGHKRLSSTQVYVHPNGDDCLAAINSLNT